MNLASFYRRGLLLLAGLFFSLSPANAQTFTANFSRWTGPPLVKTKFGVYQTPFLSPETRDKMLPLLSEAGVQDFRYEMGWGKPDTRAFDQISGTAAHPLIDFAPVDRLILGLKILGIRPLFAMTYDPLPLKTGNGWQRWKDVPNDLGVWGNIHQSYAAHYRTALGLRGPYYEIWNEPDLPGDGGKVFFNGGPADYVPVYSNAQKGLKAGDSDALVGGPGIAYDTSYVAAALTHPMDFVSIHAYANYSDQLHAVRGLLTSHPELPVFLTEYASFKTFGLHAPISRAEGASGFFTDVQGLLTFPEAVKVYWAQWVDDDLGLLTHDLHRKALYNAYKMYQTLMPVDRNSVIPETQGGVRAMASSDDHTAAVVLWNTGAEAKMTTVHLTHLPVRRGILSVWRIDNGHASYVDTPASENLSVETRQTVTSQAATWQGSIPPHGVILLRVTDGNNASLLAPAHIGTYVRSHWWFFDRAADSFAEYDPHTSIARLGMGHKDFAVAQTGIVLDNPTPQLRVSVRRQGTFAHKDDNSLFGIRVDYETPQGWTRSVLWHDGAYTSKRTSVLPWGKEGAAVDKSYLVPALLQRTGTFVLEIARSAPLDWNKRILLTPILQNEGANAQVRLIFR
jgi:hypothetical protein